MSQAQQGKTASKIADVFELKSASLSLLSLVLKSADLSALATALHERLGDTPDLFNHEPLLIDLTHLNRSAPRLGVDGSEPAQMSLEDEAATELDFAPLLLLLRRYNMQPVAVLGATAAELAQALSLGLAESPEPDMAHGHQTQAAAVQIQVQEVVKEVRVEVVREVAVPVEAAKTMIIDKPLRSGQQIYAKGGDLVVLALVNHGAEVIADGSIHVYAPLRGKAIAGAKGNTEARIFATSMEAELIAIAGTYRTTENPLPDTVFGKAAQIRLEGEKLVMEPLKL
ncbi:septum site-determining protein MinC [Roseateles oligotrophus]|uniref:Probable septum site-determining protein MinC n=1 Tax=Roseateles oligotrophus TaxID=1769250 RepID=A0ABT2YAN1_9BURK|nr:septum site-determining protein MinC [Roseateles oligotrophus]MCV2367358.1 septum site-determining protein MinC [Roseateles oligotrophus]